MSTPEDFEELKHTIRKAVIDWCEEVAVDYTSPAQVEACGKYIWGDLQKKGLIYRDTPYPEFQLSIIFESMKDDFIEDEDHFEQRKKLLC